MMGVDGARESEPAPIFISRAGSDVAVAERIGNVLEAAGYGVILQQWNFANKSFIAQMQSALETGSRVVALLSADYMLSDYCAAEWQSVLADDPLNRKSRLIVLRVGECAPSGLLKALAYWDLVAVDDAAEFERIVLQAVAGQRLRRAADEARPARVAALPGAAASENVSFLFTEIEASTERWERDSAAMQQAVRRHDALIAGAVQTAGGRIFKTPGDGSWAVFAHAAQAVAAGRDAQQSIAAADFSDVDGLRVRMAVHSGTAEELEGDYIGGAVNRTARLLAIGHGGQVLLSEAALLEARAESGAVDVRDLGPHTLKDLAKPERVYQLVVPGVASDFSELRSLTVLTHNLPVQGTDFVGRAAIVGEIKACIERARLVTVLGAGGLGKTRTAVQAAAELVDGSGDGVWFVDLAPLGTPEYVVPEIAAVLGVREERGKPLLESVLAYLKTRRLLLIFDNCEHVLAEVRNVAEAMLKLAPDVRILATSREVLGVGGESVLRLPPLVVPPAGDGLTAAEAMRYEAIALFTARAMTADARFLLTDRNAGIVADICRRLDGIALAIELAAARVKILNLAQLAQKLDERFRLLTGGRKTALPRQQTMRALIDWSYNLLAPGERELFRRLSIFAGGWTLEAATAVCGDADADEFDILDGLTSLSDKSLVVVDFAEEAQRFRLLESMRDYALELVRTGGEYEALAQRRAEYIAEFVGDGTPVRTDAERARSTAIEAELENVREVLAWALERRQAVHLGARVAYGLGQFWFRRYPREGERWLQLAYSTLPKEADPALSARIAMAMASLLPHGSFERLDQVELALREARLAGDPLIICRGMIAFAEQLAPLGRMDEAKAMFEEGLAYASAANGEREVPRAFAGLGFLAVDRNDIEAARTCCNRAIAGFDALGATDGVAYVSVTLGQAEFRAGNVRRALAYTSRARAAYGELKDVRSSAWTACDLSALSLTLGEVEEARVHARDALALLRNDRHPLYLVDALESLAFVATLHGDVERGLLLLGYTENAYGKLAHKRKVVQQRCHDLHLAKLTEAVAAGVVSARMAEGANIGEDRAIEEALAV